MGSTFDAGSAHVTSIVTDVPLIIFAVATLVGAPGETVKEADTGDTSESPASF